MIHAPGVVNVGSSSIMRLYEPRKAEEIAKHCGVSKGTVHQVISTYNRLGVQSSSFSLPSSFALAAERSPQLPRSSWRVRAQVGHEVAESTIYRLLDRHGWRPPHAASETPQRE